jgi:Uma2 family endonuclease
MARGTDRRENPRCASRQWRARSNHAPSPTLLVGEVTSGSTAENDRGPKLRGYAQAGIPRYLLIDRERGHVVVHTEPPGQRYARRTEVELGKTVALPYPFEFELDTSQF